MQGITRNIFVHTTNLCPISIRSWSVRFLQAVWARAAFSSLISSSDSFGYVLDTYGSWLWGMMVVCVCTLAMSTRWLIVAILAVFYMQSSHYLISPVKRRDTMNVHHSDAVFRDVITVGDKNAREVQIKSNVSYFVPTTRLGEECLQNVHLQTGLW